MRILVADDHDLVREMISAYLAGEGLGEIVSVGDLPEALRQVATTGRFDLVLLDYDMPGMSGLEGLQSMIAANDPSPVALISGAVTSETAEQALELGAAGFVPCASAAEPRASVN